MPLLPSAANTSSANSEPSFIDGVLSPHERDLGDGFLVRRILPSAARRAIGHFVFFDHFGPVRLSAGQGLDVRPHPHINLATVTYLFEGEILHRDSIGSVQAIRPGDINWMTAGRGIVHSERTPAAQRAAGPLNHGLQLWIALPRADEEAPPEFHHHPENTLPVVVEDGVAFRLLVGDAFGLRSPVKTFSRLLYLDVRLDQGARFKLPDEDGERGIYMVGGAVTASDGQRLQTHSMYSVRAGAAAEVVADGPARFVVVGGEPLAEPRHIWWNFVSSSAERIERAKADWRDRRGQPDGPFPLVAGDETEFIPLPST